MKNKQTQSVKSNGPVVIFKHSSDVKKLDGKPYIAADEVKTLLENLRFDIIQLEIIQGAIGEALEVEKLAKRLTADIKNKLNQKCLFFDMITYSENPAGGQNAEAVRKVI